MLSCIENALTLFSDLSMLMFTTMKQNILHRENGIYNRFKTSVQQSSSFILAFAKFLKYYTFLIYILTCIDFFIFRQNIQK